MEEVSLAPGWGPLATASVFLSHPPCSKLFSMLSHSGADVVQYAYLTKRARGWDWCACFEVEGWWFGWRNRPNKARRPPDIAGRVGVGGWSVGGHARRGKQEEGEGIRRRKEEDTEAGIIGDRG